MSTSSFDPSIPVLTEVFQAPSPTTGAATPPALDWEALERRLFERLMERLHGQIEASVERAIAQIVSDLRPGVRAAVQDIVAQEVARLQSPAA
jgi:hypothetical protein